MITVEFKISDAHNVADAIRVLTYTGDGYDATFPTMSLVAVLGDDPDETSRKQDTAAS